MKFRKYKRGNLTFISDFKLPFYESIFVRRASVKMKDKKFLLETGKGGCLVFYACEYFVRLSRKSEEIQVVLWDYDENDRLERIIGFVPITNNLKFIEIAMAREYEPVEFVSYVFRDDGYYYFFMDIDEVMSIINLEELEELMELQKKWDEMIRNS